MMTAFRSFLFVFVSAAALSLTGTGQCADHVHLDYEEFAKLFFAGKEPNFTVDNTWRKKYEMHGWRAAAEEGNAEAETLTAIYLLSFIDQQLTLQIEKIFLEKAMLNHTIAQSAVLDNIALYMAAHPKAVEELGAGSGAGIKFYTGETEKLVQQTDELVRRNMVSGSAIAKKILIEAKEFRGLFQQKESGIVANFLLMKEKFKALEDLKYQFTANWDAQRTKDTKDRLKKSPAIERIIGIRARTDASGGSTGSFRPGRITSRPSPDGQPSDGGENATGGEAGSDSSFFPSSTADTQITKEQEIEIIIDEMIQRMKDRYTAHKYLVGVYQGQDYHLETLEKIHHYLRNASEAGNPVAQCYYALFMKYLGYSVGEDDADGEKAWQKWLKQAKETKAAQERVAKLEKQAEEAKGKAAKRAETAKKRIDFLINAEDEKIATIDKMLLQAAGRAGNGGSAVSSDGRNESSRAEMEAMKEAFDADRTESMQGTTPK
ncbi:MAG: hypothetical protein LBH00_04180 [Planctomycetaceae bacterium]|jgi:hypothetical protein|nr:hypothetical protein [Planctomycetaceae bacterium]